jgi:hypothetical protein
MGVFFFFFFSVFSKFMFFFSSFLWSLHLSFMCMCTHSLFLALIFWCVCVFQFFQNFGFSMVGSAGPWRLNLPVGRARQGAGSWLLRGSLCLKPLRISYCNSQGAGWVLAEGFPPGGGFPWSPGHGASCQLRVRKETCGRVKFSLCQPLVWLVLWAPCPSQAPTLRADWVFGKFVSSMVL